MWSSRREPSKSRIQEDKGADLGHCRAGTVQGHHLRVLPWCRGRLIVYDISKSSSYENCNHWLTELRENADDNVAVGLIGNKSDLAHLRAVPTDEARNFAMENQMLFTETSALNSDNVDKAFRELIVAIFQMVSKHQVDLNGSGSNAGANGGPKGPTISLTPAPNEKKKKKSNNCC